MADGQFQLSQNVRCDDGLFKARRKDVLILAKPSWATSAAPLGAACISLNGNSYVAAVFSDGSKARLAIMPSTLDRWVEVTGTGQWTGPSGDNRFTDADNPCQFAVVPRHRERTTGGNFSSRNILVIQNGEDYPREWDPDTTNYSSYAISNVTSNGGLYRVTMATHQFQTGDHIYITGVSGTTGANGLWTVTRISSTVVDLQGSVFSGTYSAGSDFAYDKIDLGVHKPITDTTAVAQSVAGADSYFAIAGGSETTYPTTADPLQTTDFCFSDAATAPYTGTNSVIDWDITTSAATGDIAAVRFTNPLAMGVRLMMLVEGPSILAALKQAKIEFGVEDVVYASVSTWLTAFDPTGSDTTKKQFVATIIQSTAANRYWVVFDTSQLSLPTVYHMRFTRQGQAPGANQQNYILFIGAVSGNLPAAMEWSSNSEDQVNLVENRSHTMLALGKSIGSMGGPQTVTSGTANVTDPAPTYPLSELLPATFDYIITQPSDASAINGGLDGVPSHVAVYGRLPSENDPNVNPYFWLFSAEWYDFTYSGSTRRWSKNNTTDLTVTIPLPSGVTQEQFNINRQAPSAYHLPMPIGQACLYTNHRMLVGGIKDTTGQYAYADAYISWERHPFRFQQRQEDEFRGGYFQLSGEEVKAFASSAAAAFQAGRIYLFTNKRIYCLGDSGPYAGAGLTTTELSRPFFIGPHGTQSPRSIAVGYAHMFWVDQDMQMMRLGSGMPENIGQRTISDRLDASLVTRKAYMSGTFKRDRYHLAFTPALETQNNRVIVWNDIMNAVESEDYETANADFECLGVFDTNSTNPRLFFFDSVGSMYAYGESTSGTIAVRFATRGYQMKGWDTWFIQECSGFLTMNSAVSLSIARVSRTWGSDEPWTTTMSLTKTGADFARAKDNYTPSKTGTGRGTQADVEWYLDVSGTVAPDTQILRFEFKGYGSTADWGER